jgi:hypothetical protein
MDAAQLHDIQRRVVSEKIVAEEAGDWDRAIKTFADRPEAFFDAVPMHTIFHGRDGIRGFYAAVTSALPDFPIGKGSKVPIISETHVPGLSIVEVEAQGTHSGADFAGIKAKGNAVRIRVAGFFVFDKDTGGLLGERAYWDMESMLSQMR